MSRTYPIWLVLGLAMFVLGIVFSDANIGLYVNLPALIVVVFPPAFLVLSSFGWSEYGRSFRVAFRGVSASRQEMKTGVRLFGVLQRYLLLAGFIATMIGAIAMLGNLYGADEIGPVVAIALIALFYSLLLIFFVAIPFRSALENRLIVTAGAGGE